MLDAQAWLYAELQRHKAAQMGQPMSAEEFLGHEDTWKQETAALIEKLLEDTDG